MHEVQRTVVLRWRQGQDCHYCCKEEYKGDTGLGYQGQHARAFDQQSNRQGSKHGDTWQEKTCRQ